MSISNRVNMGGKGGRWISYQPVWEDEYQSIYICQLDALLARSSNEVPMSFLSRRL